MKLASILSDLLIIGLTGGIASGKSTVSRWFAEHDVAIIDADLLSRQSVTPPSATLTQIQSHFGAWIIDSSTGGLNRKALREHIFKHPSARQELEAIIHPAIGDLAIQQLSEIASQEIASYVIIDAALLIEAGQSGLMGLCDRIALVTVPPNLQISRAAHRDNQSVEQIKAIIAQQMPQSKKQRYADDIIDNGQDLEHLYAQLHHLHHTYLALAKIKSQSSQS